MRRPTPAQRARIKALAAQQTEPVTFSDEEQERVARSENNLMGMQLVDDIRRLKDTKSVQAKIELKKQLLPAYTDYVNAIITTNSGFQDDILLTIYVWFLDVGDFTRAIQVARYALKHSLVMPERYSRNVVDLLVEESADTVLKEPIKPIWKRGAIANITDKPSEYIEPLKTIIELTKSSDMHDQLRSKIYKALGYLLAINAQYAAALDQLNAAVLFNSDAGVKKDIENLQRIVLVTESDQSTEKSNETLGQTTAQ